MPVVDRPAIGRAALASFWPGGRQDEIVRREEHDAWPQVRARTVFALIERSAVVDATSISLLREVAQLRATVRAALASQVEFGQALIQDLDANWELPRPIFVITESHDDHVIARAPELSAYGEGVTEQEALADLRNNLIEGREGLEGLSIGSELAERWTRLIQPAVAATASR
jgi:hypothetical protein